MATVKCYQGRRLLFKIPVTSRWQMWRLVRAACKRKTAICVTPSGATHIINFALVTRTRIDTVESGDKRC